MNHSTLVKSFVAATVVVAAVVVSVAEHDKSGAIKNDGGNRTSFGAVTMVMAADLSGVSGNTTHAWAASPVLAVGDSRHNNYRLERDSCCIGNE